VERRNTREESAGWIAKRLPRLDDAAPVTRPHRVFAAYYLPNAAAYRTRRIENLCFRWPRCGEWRNVAGAGNLLLAPTGYAGRSRAASVREDSMYAAIRQAKAKTGTAEELARRIKEGAIPIISDVEGFMAYYVVYAPDDTVTAISLFNNFAGAEEANRRAIAWIEQNLGPLLVGPASAVAGPVIVHTLA
jgi:hypothetical protein